MTDKKTRVLSLFLALIMGLAFTFTLSACGSSEDADIDPKAPAEEETDPYDSLSDSEKAALKEKAVIMNKDEKNFIGVWKGDEDTYDVYGNLTVTINEDGTVRIETADEDLPGTWKKIDGGISYSTELMRGKIYFGETCQMTIGNEDKDLGEDEFFMTLTKQK